VPGELVTASAANFSGFVEAEQCAEASLKTLRSDDAEQQARALAQSRSLHNAQALKDAGKWP